MGYAYTWVDGMKTQVVKDEHRLGDPALRAFAQISKAWSLTESEQSALLAQPAWAANAMLSSAQSVEVPRETLERISYILGIYRAVHTIFPNKQQADAWVRRRNSDSLFHGASALALMCSGRLDDLAAVRQHLEAGGLLDT